MAHIKLVARAGTFALLALLMGCGAKWKVEDQRFFKYQNHDLRIAGRISMTEESNQLVDGDHGVTLNTRLYTDEYSTMIRSDTQRVGRTLEDLNSKGKKEIFTEIIKDIRLGGTANSYPYLCAEIQVDDSNVSEWTRVGCVYRDDTPSESETGGIGQEDPRT